MAGKKKVEEETKKKDKKGKKPDFKPTIGYTTDFEIVEECFNKKGGRIWFERYNRVIDSFDKIEKIGFAVPDTGEMITKGVLSLSSGIEDYGSQEQLIEDIIAFIHKYNDLDPWFEKISAYYILLSWMQDKLNTLPYLRLMGDKGTGKSRFNKTVGKLAYRSFSSVNANSANIYRIMDMYHGTIVFEEFIPSKSNDSVEIIQILNAGFEKDNFIPRSNADKTYTQKVFDAFGAKILLTRGQMTSNAFESRCITCVSEETSRNDIPTLLGNTFEEELEVLKKKLLKWRMKNWHSFDIDIGIDMEKELLQGISGRVKQVYLPFAPLVYGTQYESEFVEIVKKADEDGKEMDMDSPEGRVFNAWMGVYLRDGYATTNAISDFARNKNEKLGNAYDDYFNPHYCTNLLKALKLVNNRKRISPNKVVRTWQISPKQLGNLAKRYTDNANNTISKIKKKNSSQRWRNN